jgi:hypothetical protein
VFIPCPLQVADCPNMDPHDWTECPFAHPGEKARRRDPKCYLYTGVACPDFRKVRRLGPGQGVDTTRQLFAAESGVAGGHVVPQPAAGLCVLQDMLCLGNAGMCPGMWQCLLPYSTIS